MIKITKIVLLISLIFIALIFITIFQGGTCETEPPPPPTKGPDFYILLSKGTINIEQGNSEILTVDIIRSSGHSKDIQLSLEGLPSDISASFSPNPVTPHQSSILTISVDSNAVVSNYSLEVKAIDGILVRRENLFCAINSPANPWKLQPSGEFNSLYGVDFINTDYGFAVGDGGTVLKTTNGGTTWNEQIIDLLLMLKNVQFFDQMKGIIVGASNEAYYTSDGGTTWNDIHYMYGVASLNGVSFLDDQTGWVAGNVVLYTYDAGTDWVVQIPNDPATIWWDIAMTDNAGDYNGVVVGEQNGNTGIIRYTPHGEQWLDSNIPAGMLPLYAVCSVNPTTFYAAGFEGRILKSTDSGINWTEVGSVPDIIQGISATDENNLWVAGQEIYHSSDGGQTWTEEMSLTNDTFYDIYMIPNSGGTGYSVGSINKGIIYRRD